MAASALVLAAVAAYIVVDGLCFDCDQPIAATGTTSTTTQVLDELSADSDIREALDVDIDVRGFAAFDAGAATTNGDGGEISTSSDGSSTSTSNGSSTTDPSANANAQGTANGDATTTSTSTTVALTTAPPATTAAGSNVPVSGSAIYVNPNGGNDGNDGTSQSTAIKSLQNAFRRVQAGQTVYLMNGEYRETASVGSLHYFLKNSGSASNWIRVTNAPGHSPVIVATSGTALLIEANYIEVSGLTIRGEGFSASNSWGVGVSIGRSHHVRILNSRISGMATSGISVNESSNVHLINNTVYENAYWSDVNGSGISFYHQRSHGHGADYGQYHDVVIGNRVFRNENKVPSKHQNYQIITDGNGIIIDSNRNTGYGGRTLVANNLIYDNGGRGVITWDSNHVDIMFNTTYRNGRTADIIGGAAELAAAKVTDVKLHHNIGWARPGNRALVIDQHSNTSSQGNVLVTDRGDSTAWAGDTVFTGNPGLRNPSTNGGSADFRPSPGGGLIGAAAYDGIVPRDIVGTSRGGGVEPGAFEAEAVTGR